MAIDISTYVDPGVYIDEVVVPGNVTASTVPLAVCLIGVGNRTKRASNEAITRGLVSGEQLTVGSSSPYNATLINASNRKSAQLTVYRDGTAIDSSYITIQAASLTGIALTTLDFTTANMIGLSMDGKQAVTIKLATGADSTTISGSLITQTLGSISSITAVTPAQIAEGINKALAGASTLGYGSAYGAVATVASSKIVLTSPNATSASDVTLYRAFPTASGATAAIFGVSLPYKARTTLTIADSLYLSTSVYTADYVSVETTQDTLTNTSVQSVLKVGSYAGVTSFKQGVDYNISTNHLDWSIATAATLTSSIASASFDLSANDTILLALDGKSAATIKLNAMASPPPGYANPAVVTAATPAEIANNINAVLANSASYGPKYRAVASVSGVGAASKLVLTSPGTGTGSMVQLGAPTSASAVTALFGLVATQLPYEIYGVGSSPAAGAMYFGTYTYTRPTSDYNTPKRFYTPDSLYSDIGVQAKTNQLAIGAGICFDNSAPSVMVVQINDATFPGSPTQAEIQAALDAAGNTASATEICVLDTRSAVAAAIVNHVTAQCSATQKNYRRGWFGMAAGTLIGDKDTSGTYVHRAVRTLQVPGDSPARGRLILVAPGGVDRTITLEDGSSLTVNLDGSYVAAAIAARMTAFTSPSDTLLRKTIVGFNTSTFPTYLKAERGMLAQNGVTVVTQDSGKLVLMDPITTEAGGGKLVTFSEISASTQKDSVTTTVSSAVDANLVGVVPSDLASFILTIKGFIANVLTSQITSGAIAPFKTPDGVVRDVNVAQDIQVFQDKSDTTKFYFRYYYNLRLPAKRFMGTYSVNNPFFAS